MSTAWQHPDVSSVPGVISALSAWSTVHNCFLHYLPMIPSNLALLAEHCPRTRSCSQMVQTIDDSLWCLTAAAAVHVFASGRTAGEVLIQCLQLLLIPHATLQV